MDNSVLARKMLEWEALRRQADALEAEILSEIEAREETVITGNVEASYCAGRKSYDYRAAAAEAPDEIVMAYTEVVEKVDWRSVALDGLGIPKVDIPFKQYKPSIKLKLRG